MNVITEFEIREKLSNHHGDTQKPYRQLIRQKMQDSYEEVGSIHYSLNGSPPKGYAIYTPRHRLVSLYNNRGKRFRILRDVIVHNADGEAVSDNW